MAESLKVEEHLICSVCLQQFKDPKVLPCLHSYCHVCIVNLTKSSKTDTINCPDCRVVVKVDENTISSLPKNFFVNNLLATMALTNDQPSVSRKIVCDNCDNEDAAESRCNECGMFLCQFCTDSHKRYRSTKLHKLLTMEELKSSASPQNIAEKMKCPKHKDEVIKLFCKTCQTTICRDCIIVDHRRHNYGFVEEVAVKEKQHLQQNLNEVKQRKARLLHGIANLKKFNERLEAKMNSTISEIDKHFTELANAVDSRKHQMVTKVTRLTNSKQKQINAQLEALEMASVTCESSIEFTEQAFNNGNDIQILSMEKYILQSLEQLKTVKDLTEPCVTEDMMFMIPSSVKETEKKLLNKYDVVVQVASPGNCIASFDEAGKLKGNLKQTSPALGGEALEAGKQYAITLICNDKYNQRLRHGGQDIKPSFTGMEVSDITVTDNKDGSYIISFCPRQGGMLRFDVSIDGMSAPKCSLTSQVIWVISDVYGKGVITDGGKTMKGDGRNGEYSCRVGGCHFDSGTHTWKVQVTKQNHHGGYDSVEVGIIDCDEIHANIAKSKTKWVNKCNVRSGYSVTTSLTLDMDKKILNVATTNLDPYNQFYRHTTGTTQSYQFTACRVSPFFACSSPSVTLSIVE